MGGTKRLEIRPYFKKDGEQVIALWKQCGLVVPWNDPQKDIDRKMNKDPDLFLVCCLGDTIIGTVMGGYEGHRGWINYLAVGPDHQHQGVGRKLMAAVESKIQALGCPKINLQVRESNSDALAFYEALGYGNDRVIGLGKRLVHDV